MEDIGHTIKIMTKGVKRYEWFYQRIKRYLGNAILEIGSGIGGLAKFFIDRNKIICTDINQKSLVYLKKRFRKCSNVIVKEYNLESDPCPFLNEQIDTVICTNVLEHVSDDVKALSNLYKILIRHGKLILLIPAMSKIYGSLDKDLGHYRRYDKKEIIKKMEKVGFEIIHSEYINMLAVIGWYLNSRILKRKTVSSSNMILFNLSVSLLKIERYLKFNWGISLFVVGKKT